MKKSIDISLSGFPNFLTKLFHKVSSKKLSVIFIHFVIYFFSSLLEDFNQVDYF